MAVIRNIGKNTLGDNNKMTVAMHDYEMSTHDISTVFRSTLGVGTLTPCLKILCQKGDIINLNMINKTLTQPTLGAMFGTYKLQHFLFFAGFRLYNSWLHNNRTGIGMDMKQIKLPMMKTNNNGAAEVKHNSSSLYKYLGWTGQYGSHKKNYYLKQGVPLLMYLDIFKNYFANTQEDDVYFFGKEITLGGKVVPTKITSEQLNKANKDKPFLTEKGDKIIISSEAENDHTSLFNPQNKWGTDQIIFTIEDLKFANAFDKAKVKIMLNSADEATLLNLSDMFTKSGLKYTSKTTEVISNGVALNTTSKVNILYFEIKKNDLPDAKSERKISKVKLETLDKVRDEILATKGNTTYKLGLKEGEDEDVKELFNKIANAQQEKLGGLFLKTYDSDIFNNWLKKEWIEGPSSINEITAVNVQDGKLSLDSLNLQQKVYNMLNRIAVSGGRYRDWLETVYTAGKYLDRPETPIFIGGMTQYINFQEINSTTASSGETNGTGNNIPLGDIASIGRGTEPINSGHIHYQCEEPGYIMGIVAITPLIDYSQGNDFDLNLETMDDLHKPALDGIGYQDLNEEQMVYYGADQKGEMPSEIKHVSIGKTTAWIDYMTNFNRTYGDFADGEELDYMVLNRRYERIGHEETYSDNGNIADMTTYIDPNKHIEIFADTTIDSQNFWVQTAFNITRRGNYSAKQIPNL